MVMSLVFQAPCIYSGIARIGLASCYPDGKMLEYWGPPGHSLTLLDSLYLFYVYWMIPVSGLTPYDT